MERYAVTELFATFAPLGFFLCYNHSLACGNREATARFKWGF